MSEHGTDDDDDGDDDNDDSGRSSSIIFNDGQKAESRPFWSGLTCVASRSISKLSVNCSERVSYSAATEYGIDDDLSRRSSRSVFEADHCEEDISSSLSPAPAERPYVWSSFCSSSDGIQTRPLIQDATLVRSSSSSSPLYSIPSTL